ncbi:MAG: hypothetical protein JSU91_07375, partial [Thermoplasmatales archaeon]
MVEEPEIVKELREAEKLGILYTMINSAIEEIRGPIENEKKGSEHSSHIVEDFKKGTSEGSIGSIEEKYRTIFDNYAIGITL